MAVKAVGCKATTIPNYKKVENKKKPLPVAQSILKEISLNSNRSVVTLKNVTARSVEEPFLSDPKKILLSMLEEHTIADVEEIFDKTLYHSDHLKFKKNFALAILQFGIVEQDRVVLHSALASKMEYRKKPLSYFLEAIAEAKKLPITSEKEQYLSRLERELVYLKRPNEASQPFPFSEMIELCLEAEHKLEMGAEKTDIVYLRASSEKLPRSMAIDFSRKVFTIMSGKHGALNASGGFKKVTDAIQLRRIASDEVVAKRMAKLVNKADREIYEQELTYEKRFGNIDSIFSYKPKYSHSNKKTALLEEVYDHDMYIFTGYTDEEKRKKLPFDELLTVLEQVGSEIQKMHSQGIAHRDVKTKNILFRRTDAFGIETKLCDFGHTTEPKNEQLQLSKARRHATVRYSAPEVLEFTPGKYNPFVCLKAIDMYGLGMVIYELYFQKPCPWAHDVFRAIKHHEKDGKAKGLSMQKTKAKELYELSSGESKTHETVLLGILSRLLEIDPEKRMGIDEFQANIRALKGSYMANKP